mmetsp:Transcript_9421/g.18552  ORF Transcript_9421/g.18552 Transcript_9421/m.18552 type:complete len:224 (+) Transcript_9421:61-732(+)
MPEGVDSHLDMRFGCGLVCGFGRTSNCTRDLAPSTDQPPPRRPSAFGGVFFVDIRIRSAVENDNRPIYPLPGRYRVPCSIFFVTIFCYLRRPAQFSLALPFRTWASVSSAPPRCAANSPQTARSYASASSSPFSTPPSSPPLLAAPACMSRAPRWFHSTAPLAQLRPLPSPNQAPRRDPRYHCWHRRQRFEQKLLPQEWSCGVQGTRAFPRGRLSCCVRAPSN